MHHIKQSCCPLMSTELQRGRVSITCIRRLNELSLELYFLPLHGKRCVGIHMYDSLTSDPSGAVPTACTSKAAHVSELRDH